MVTVADLVGVRVVVEGRVGDSVGIRSALMKRAHARVEEGISPMCLAVLYPTEVRSGSSVTAMRKALEKATLKVRVVTEASDGEWVDSTVDELTDILRRSYEVLVSEDVVAKAVAQLHDAIEAASAIIVDVPASGPKIRVLLGIPEETISNPRGSK